MEEKNIYIHIKKKKVNIYCKENGIDKVYSPPNYPEINRKPEEKKKINNALRN
jgi:hypothetical protein